MDINEISKNIKNKNLIKDFKNFLFENDILFFEVNEKRFNINFGWSKNKLIFYTSNIFYQLNTKEIFKKIFSYIFEICGPFNAKLCRDSWSSLNVIQVEATPENFDNFFKNSLDESGRCFFGIDKNNENIKFIKEIISF